MSSILGENIKRFRIKLGLNIKELSDKAGVGSSTISQIETGKRKSLRSESLEKIAYALGISTNDLLNINEGTYQVADLLEAIELILADDEISIDNITLTKEEKENFKFAIQIAINTIRDNRRK